MMNIVFSSTKQLADAIQAGRVSAVEVLEAHLAQIEAHNPSLNAIVTLDAEQARVQARAADAAQARGETVGHCTATLYTEGRPRDGGYAHHHWVPATGRLCAAGRQHHNRAPQ